MLARKAVQLQSVLTHLEAPPAAGMAAEIAVHWKGPGGRNDYITVVPLDAKDRHMGNYAYTRHGTPAGLRMPERPGDYELRYVTGREKRVLARRPIRVDAVDTGLQAPDAAPAGSELAVNWQGPGGHNDYITVVPADSEDRKLGIYAYARHGSPAKLRMPDQPGEYEIRYLTGQEKQVLARADIRVDEVETSLQAPDSGIIGQSMEVAWSGPGHRRDMITVALAEQSERKFITYAYAGQGSPARLNLPDNPGDYEIRYLTAGDRLVLARLPLRVESAPATLDAPPAVGAKQPFEVQWSGPDGNRDRIVIAAAGSGAKQMLTYANTRTGSPVRLKAPEKPGGYELRYVTGQTHRVLHSRPLQVLP